MKLDYLREFVTLAQYLNFSAAAKRLYMTQSALSRHIILLEEEFGAKLFERDTHGVILTSVGKTCLDEVRAILKRYDELVARIDQSTRGTEGVIRIGFLNYTMSRYVNPVFGAITSSHPKLSIEPCPSSPAEIVDNVLNGVVDIGLFMHVPLPADDLLWYCDVREEGLSVFVSRTSELADKGPIPLSALIDEKFLSVEDSYQHCYERAISRLCARHGFVPKPGCKVSNLEAVFLAIQRGEGVYVFPRSAQTWGIGDVIAIDIADDDCALWGCAVYRRDNDNPALPLVVREYEKLVSSGEYIQDQKTTLA